MTRIRTVVVRPSGSSCRGARSASVGSWSVRSITTSLVIIVMMLLTGEVLAQQAPVIIPPKLVRFVEATYPPAAEQAALEATVELLITVAADGTVSDAAVVSPVGNGFDESAVAAAKHFVFQPATRDGTPIAARIKYRYVFELKTVPVAPPTPGTGNQAPPPRGVLRGRVVESTTSAPLAGVDVTVRGAVGGEPVTVVTDADGRFVVPGLAAGTYQVRIVTFDAGELTAEETLAADEDLEVTYRLVRTKAIVETSEEEYGATATIEAPSREVTRRSIAREEMTKLPGTRGDALRGVELLPGVARPPGGLGILIVRGAAPGDSQFFLDGAPVPGIYHFGGLTSIVNGQLLERIDLYPGNFSVRYGRRTGGVVEAGFRDPDPDRAKGIVDINLLDASLVVETPLADDLAIAVAARRSYVDFWFESVIPDDTLAVETAPVYDDYQVLLTYKPSARDRFRLFGYGSRDRLALFLDEPADGDPAVRGNLGFSTAIHRLQAEWRRKQSKTTELEIRANGGYTSFDIGLGDTLGLDVSGFTFSSRGELRVQPAEKVGLNVGYDIEGSLLDITFQGPRFGQREGAPQSGGPLDARETITTVIDADFVEPAVYLESVVKPIAALEITAGARGDFFASTRDWSVDPRLAAKYTSSDTTYKLAVGRFSQPPNFAQTDDKLGNPALDPIRSIHYGLGVDQRLSARASLGAEAFYKELDGLVVDNADRTMLINAGIGRIYGLELAGRLQPGGRVSGFLSYTFSRSQRNDRGDAWRLFDFDQTHILTVAGSGKLAPRWELGGTFRLVSGNPDTPVVASLYDANFDVYQPIYGAVNSIRSPVFHRVDVRIERRFDVGRALKWFAYLDLQNAYNHQSIEGTRYNYDFTQRRYIKGLPILPSLGIRGQL